MTIKELYEEAQKRGKEEYTVCAYNRYGFFDEIEEPVWEWDEMGSCVLIEGEI